MLVQSHRGSWWQILNFPVISSESSNDPLMNGTYRNFAPNYRDLYLEEHSSLYKLDKSNFIRLLYVNKRLFDIVEVRQEQSTSPVRSFITRHRHLAVTSLHGLLTSSLLPD